MLSTSKTLNQNVLNEKRNWEWKPGQCEYKTLFLTRVIHNSVRKKTNENNNTNENKTVLANVQR